MKMNYKFLHSGLCRWSSQNYSRLALPCHNILQKYMNLLGFAIYRNIMYFCNSYRIVFKHLKFFIVLFNILCLQKTIAAHLTGQGLFLAIGALLFS